MTTTIYGRLTAVESDPIGEGLVRTWPRNPDGPEAAELLRVMLAGLLAACDAIGDRYPAGDREMNALLSLRDAIEAARAAGVPET